MIYFISEAKIKEMINDNVESELIRTSITTIQMVNLKTIIGDSLYETIEKLIENNVVVDPYKTLLDGYIIPYMQYAVLAELVIPSTYKIGNIGVNQAYTESVNTTTMSDCKYLKQYYTDRSAFMEQRLTDYLNKNRSIFTDYDNYQDITTSRSTSMQSGLFLGGRTKSNNVSNEKTLLHDSTIRAYIRYDEPQNLTPEAQAQAKRNIGIDNINFDDIYTKDEINDNYYTKNEVDNLVDNVQVDLSGYYTKEETDTLISNINTFSGDYNDLSNKPIVDLLSLPNNQQVNEIDFYSDIFIFTNNRIMTIEGVILNGNKCVYEIIGTNDNGMPIKQVDFHINRTANSFIIRFITRYGENNENIPYEFIYTNENGDMLDTLNLVTKAELEETIGNINNILETI